MDNKEFSKQLESRTKQFALSIIRLSSSLPVTYESNVIKNQITKSGTSVGANYREANRARSKPEFLSKIRLSEGEASETLYWLEIINEMGWIPKESIQPIIKEATEIVSIFTSIGNKLKQKNSEDKPIQ